MLATIFAFAPQDQPRGHARVPPGGKDSIDLKDDSRSGCSTPVKITPVPPQAIDHIVFSESDSIPHSTYRSINRRQATDTCGKMINDLEHCPVPVVRPERRQSKFAHQDVVGAAMNHEVKLPAQRATRVPPGGYQTFTLA